MKTLITLLSLVFMVSLALPHRLIAQEDMQPTRMENVDWKRVIFIEWLPGKRGRAMEIIHDHYQKAAKKAGWAEPQIIEMSTGSWDAILIWPMEEGPEQLTWALGPGQIAWTQALNAQEGGKEQGDALQDEYRSLIARSEMQVGRVRE